MSIAANLLTDSFLLLAPLSWLILELRLKPTKLSDLRIAFEKLGLKAIKPSAFAKQAIALFIAIAIVGVALAQGASFFQVNDMAPIAGQFSEIVATAPLFLAYLLIVRVAAEEVLFRGFLVPKIGILGSSVVFAAMHASYGSYLEVAGAFLLGLILAYAFKRWQNLFPIIAAHTLYNIFALSIILGVI